MQRTTLGDVISVGQLAQQWDRPTYFVQSLIDQGKLTRDERGLVTIESVRAYYKDHGSPVL